jgi:hypothetical protein
MNAITSIDGVNTNVLIGAGKSSIAMVIINPPITQILLAKRCVARQLP